MPDRDINTTVGGCISYPPRKGVGEKKRSRECKCSHTSSESRAQLILWLLFASAHADSSGKSSRNIRLHKLCEIPPRIWCRNRLMLSSRPPVAAVGSCTMRDLVDEAVVQGHGAPNNYYSVKWNWTGSVASEPNVESAVGSTERVRSRNSARWSRAASGSFRGQSLCLLDLPEERGFTVTNPGRTGCSRGQYDKQAFRLCTNIPDPHAPTDANTYLCIELQPAEIKLGLLHMWAWMLLERCEVIVAYLFYGASPWRQKLDFARVLRFKLAFKSLIRGEVEL